MTRWVLVALLVGGAVCDVAAQSPPALFPITVNDKHGMIDRTGAFVIGPRFAEARPFSEGLAQVGLADQWGEMKYGYIDKIGALVIPAILDRAMKFSEGLAAAKLDKHYGYLDRAGTWVISPRFVWVRPFHGGLAFVGAPGSRGAYIDATGRVVWPSP